MTTAEMRGLARRGAELELTKILKAFPELRKTHFNDGGVRTVPKARRRMSAAARKAASVRMTKVWADRRKAKGKK